MRNPRAVLVLYHFLRQIVGMKHLRDFFFQPDEDGYLFTVRQMVGVAAYVAFNNTNIDMYHFGHAPFRYAHTNRS